MRLILKFVVGFLALVISLVLSVFLIINLVDWNKHKNLLVHNIERFTPLRIDEVEGIKLQLWRSAEAEVALLKLHMEGEDSSLASFSSGPMAIRIAMEPLILKKQLLIQSFTLDSARLRLREVKSKEPAPEKDETPGEMLKSLPKIFINLASITDSDFNYKDVSFSIEKFQVEAPKDDPSPKLRGNGVFGDLTWKIEGETGSLETFKDSAKPFPVALNGSLGKHSVDARGTVLFADSTGDFKVKAKGPNFEDIKKLFRLNLGSIPAYDLAFVTHLEPQKFGFKDIELKLGQSLVHGSGQLNFRAAVPTITAQLVSPVTVQKDWAGIFKTDKRYKDKNEPPKAPGQYFSDKVVDVSALKKLDVDVHYVVKEFRGEKSGVAIRAWDAKIGLKKGDLRIDPVTFSVAAGTIGGRFHMDGRKLPLDVAIQLGAKRIDLNYLLGPISKEIPVFKLKPSDMARGMLTGQLDLKMRGKSPMELVKTIQGPIQLAVEDGKLSGTVIEAFGIDITQTISNMINKNPLYDIQCALTSFQAEEGAIKSKTFLIATKDTSIIGKGQVNLVGNKVDFVLNAHPHDFSIGSLRSPIWIKGPLNDIKVGLERQELLTRSGLAIALGTLVNPLAALVPLIEPGLDKSGKCRNVVQELQQVNEKAARLSSGQPKKNTR